MCGLRSHRCLRRLEFGKLFTATSTTVSSIKQQPQQQQQAGHSESPCISSSVGESSVGESPIDEPKVKDPLDCDELYSIELCAAEPSENLIDDELQDDRIPHRRIPEPEELLLDNRVNDYRTPGYKMVADWGVGHGHGNMKGGGAYLNESTLSHIELEPGHGAYDCPSKCILGIDPDQLHEIGLNLFTKMFIHQKIKRVPAVKDATFEFNVKFRDDPTLASAVAGPSGST